MAYDLEIDKQMNSLYNMIRKKISLVFTAYLNNFKNLFPEYGTLDLFQPYINHYLYDRLITNKKLSSAEKKTLTNDVIQELMDYLEYYDERLKEYLKNQLVKAKTIYHSKTSVFASDKLTFEKWNSLNYTQISPKRRDTSINKGQWSAVIYKGCKAINSPSLEHIANFNVLKKNKTVQKNTVLMFHGSSGKNKDSLINNIDWTKGGGALGQGFYLTFNPNEAKVYACQTAKWQNYKAIILEIQIKNADKVFQIKRWPNKLLNTLAYVRNPRKNWSDQLNIRNAIKNITIKRVHIFSIEDLIHHSASQNLSLIAVRIVDPKSPGYPCKKKILPLVIVFDKTLPNPWIKYWNPNTKKNVYYNPQTRQSQWNRPKSVRKKSRKRSRKLRKKTVKEKRAECKAKGLVYDIFTGKCRKSKHKVRGKGKSRVKRKGKRN